MTDFIFVALLIVAILCFLDLRLGMCLILVAGFLQDPLRKVVPDAPVYYSALVVVLAAITFVGAMYSGAIRPFRAIPEWNTRLKGPILLFVALVVLQSVASLAYTGSFFLAGIGLLVYLSPFPALLLAYSFASTADQLRAFFWLYVVVCAAMVSGVYLSRFGVEWEILQTVGERLVVYSLETGAPLVLPCGFLRTPEVAAWHAASGACIALMLGLSERHKGSGFVTIALVLFFAGVVILTGRRKFLLEIAMFLATLWWLLWRFRMATGRIFYLLLAVAFAGLVVVVSGLAESDTHEAFQAPVVRGEDRGNELLERIANVTVDAFPYVVEANGFFGSGAGTGSGGAQYYGGGDEIVGLAAEGGLGKVLAELGVPGILLFFWLGIRVAVQVWRMLGLAAKGDPEVATLMFGITAFLVANVLVFVGAHQVYSDPFILLFLGNHLGFVFATHRFLAARRPSNRLSTRQQALHRARGFRS